MFTFFWIVGFFGVLAAAFFLFREIGRMDEDFCRGHATVGWIGAIIISGVPVLNVLATVIVGGFYLIILAPENKGSWFNQPYVKKQEKK